MKLAHLGEFGLIDRIRARVTADAGILRGIGDDCAQLRLGADEDLLTSTDMLLEGVHFRWDWTTAADLGWKAVAVNVSDVAAMGGRPRALYLALAVPETAAVAQIEALMDGFLAAAQAYGAVLVGGDTCRSPGPWVLSVTVEGLVPRGEAVGRDGARPGDHILVSGTLGESALALALLQQGRTPAPALAQRHHRPQARAGLGRALAAARLPTAMIDLSDGLSSDLWHLLRASGCGGRLRLADLPVSAACRQAGGDAALALRGGEDYELLLTLPPARVEAAQQLAADQGLPLTDIGAITAEPDLWVCAGQGEWQPCPPGGFNHFGDGRS